MASSVSQDKQDPPSLNTESKEQGGLEGATPESGDQSENAAKEDLRGARPKERPETKDDEEGEPSDPDILPVTDACLEKLSQGLLQAILPHFQKHEESLTELTRNQVLLIETLQQENQKFSENKMVEDLTKMMLEAKQYQIKLVAIKKEMTSLHEKSTKLKRKALKLQQQKMKDNLEKEQQREREIEEDRKLTAKRPGMSAAKTAPHR